MATDLLTRTAVDDIFNADFSDFDDDLFADKPSISNARDDKVVLSPRAGAKRKAGDDDKENYGLGLDEEVKVVKKRKPIAKLDEARLLSEPGIPRLRAITRSGQLAKKLRLKGKGHEFTDAARLLNHFQLWLDNLYPRAKFADALQLVEKAGHTKRMHITRNEWINEGKPGYRKHDDTLFNEELQNEPDLFGNQANTAANVSEQSSTSAPPPGAAPDNNLDDDALFIPDANRPSQLDRENEPADDELDALLAAQDDIPLDNNLPSRPQTKIMDESEGEDDLDALLAEQDTRKGRAPPLSKATPTSRQPQEDEDDLDALMAEQEMRETTSSTHNPAQTNSIPIEQPSIDDEEEDDLEALLAVQRSTSAKSKAQATTPEPGLPTPQPTSSPGRAASSTPRASKQADVPELAHSTMFSSSPVPNNPEYVDLDDLDALLASQEAKITAREEQEREDREASTPKADAQDDVMLDDDEDDFLGPAMPNVDSQ